MDGVPFKVYENAPDILRFPKTWCRAGGVSTTLVKSYFQNMQFCFSTPEFTTSWQCLEVDINNSDTTVPCTRRLLTKPERASVGPIWRSNHKSHAASQLWRECSLIWDSSSEMIQSPRYLSALGRWYDVSLKDKDQVKQLHIISGLHLIDNTQLPVKLKTWCLQFGLLTRVLCPLAVYAVLILTLESCNDKLLILLSFSSETHNYSTWHAILPYQDIFSMDCIIQSYQGVECPS